MVRKFFYKLLSRRHFWRYATFDEVAELYVSRMLRMAALYLMNAFVSIYLYQIGYSVSAIAFLWVAFYAFKIVMALPLARLIGWIGPKHAILISNLLYIPVMIAMAVLPEVGEWILLPTFFFQGMSGSMYAIAYHVDFSKVKSLTHAGKEMAYMNIFEKITTGLSPVVGGFIAYIWGPQVVIVIAAILFALAAGPLFKTGEPVRVKQKLTLRGFPWKLLFRHAFAQYAYGFDVFASGTVWTLYVGVIIIGISASNNDVYAITGVLVSVVFIVAIIASYTYGRLIDRKKGRELMETGAVASAITHALRPFVQTPVTVAGLNAAHEVATTGYTLPFTRGFYDNADLSGARVTYLGLVDMLSNIGAGASALALALLTQVLPDDVALRALFFIAAATMLLVLTARFPLYKK